MENKLYIPPPSSFAGLGLTAYLRKDYDSAIEYLTIAINTESMIGFSHFYRRKH